jgi:hypothetical protein
MLPWWRPIETFVLISSWWREKRERLTYADGQETDCCLRADGLPMIEEEWRWRRGTEVVKRNGEEGRVSDFILRPWRQVGAKLRAWITPYGLGYNFTIARRKVCRAKSSVHWRRGCNTSLHATC